jgi:hypothetical protein
VIFAPCMSTVTGEESRRAVRQGRIQGVGKVGHGPTLIFFNSLYLGLGTQ